MNSRLHGKKTQCIKVSIDSSRCRICKICYLPGILSQVHGKLNIVRLLLFPSYASTPGYTRYAGHFSVEFTETNKYICNRKNRAHSGRLQSMYPISSILRQNCSTARKSTDRKMNSCWAQKFQQYADGQLRGKKHFRQINGSLVLQSTPCKAD